MRFAGGGGGSGHTVATGADAQPTKIVLSSSSAIRQRSKPFFVVIGYPLYLCGLRMFDLGDPCLRFSQGLELPELVCLPFDGAAPRVSTNPGPDNGGKDRQYHQHATVQ